MMLTEVCELQVFLLTSILRLASNPLIHAALESVDERLISFPVALNLFWPPSIIPTPS